MTQIFEEFFISEIKKLADLTGQRVLANVASLLYHELKHTELQDFIDAVQAMKYLDKRITLGNLSYHIDMAGASRRETEALEDFKDHKERTAQFYKENYQYIKDGKCNRQCITCPVKYCDVIHKHSIQAMRDMLDGSKTLDQVTVELSDEFMGWSNGFKEQQPEPF